MKTDRLLAETLYLLQHERVTAHQLAERFEVSVRTISRDMDSLCLAGVPVIAFEGAGGGYALDERYRIDHRAANAQDVDLIVTALQALSTAVHDTALRNALEKYRTLASAEQRLHVDLSALAEDVRVQQHLAALRTAIAHRHIVRIRYTNAEGMCAEHIVEPMELHYRWYAWYLHAYSRTKQAVLTYKLVRMDEVIETNEVCTEHESAQLLPDERETAELTIRCTEKARVPLIEYLHAHPQEQLENGDWLLHTTLPVQERFWRGALLSLGKEAELLSPPELVEEMRRLAEELHELYGK